MKFETLVADCPWSFSDRLTMSNVKRGAESQYKVLSNKDIIDLPVKDIAADNAVLALWVPSSLLDVGLETMKAWGFEFKQTHVWVKTKQEPFKELIKDLKKIRKSPYPLNVTTYTTIVDCINRFSLNDSLAFGMGRLFRQTHEIALVGTRGKVYNNLANKSQRSVHLSPATKHSVKPENLQDMLDIMFPNSSKLEMFARRQRNNWTCVGNECSSTLGEDIRDSIERLKD